MSFGASETAPLNQQAVIILPSSAVQAAKGADIPVRPQPPPSLGGPQWGGRKRSSGKGAT